MIKIFFIFFLLPLTIFANHHIPYYKSLSNSESWLRHYPDLKDFKEQTEKFFLAQKGMPIKVIEEHQSIGSNYIDWYRIEIFNGIQGWIYHNQLSRKRSLLILEDTELYVLSSMDPSSFLTIQKGEIKSPKIVNILEVTPSMIKINIPLVGRSEIKGWIPRDGRVWGDDPKDLETDFD